MRFTEIKHRDDISQYISTLSNLKICDIGTRTGDFLIK